MQITVSLMVEIPASADINEIEEHVQEAGRQAMRKATQKAVRAAEEQRKTCSHCGSEASRSEGTDQRVILTRIRVSGAAVASSALSRVSAAVSPSG